MSAGLKPLILAKVKSFNPGGSVKDRPATKMIETAGREGLLSPGGTIIEPTSGNTGTGLSQIAAVKGCQCILVCPDKVAPEKIKLWKAYGAEVVIVPTSVSASSPESCYSIANKLTNKIPGAFQPNQLANPDNPEAHSLSTGPEIWEATAGKVTCFAYQLRMRQLNWLADCRDQSCLREALKSPGTTSSSHQQDRQVFEDYL